MKTEAAAAKGSTVETIHVASTIVFHARSRPARHAGALAPTALSPASLRDVWVDRSEVTIRYLAGRASTGVASTGHRLLPMNFCEVDGSRRTVKVEAILASQFANVPAIASPDQITLREEDKVCAYYGGGTLYATPARGESLL